MNESKSFIVFTEWLEDVEALDDKERSELLLAMFRYANGLEVPEMQRTTALIWRNWKRNIDRNFDKWETIKEKRAAAAKARWDKQKDATNSDAKQNASKNANADFAKQSNAKNANADFAKHNVNVNENVNGNKNVNVNENVNENVNVNGNGNVIEEHARTSDADAFFANVDKIEITNPFANLKKTHGKYGTVELTDEEYKTVLDHYGSKASEAIQHLDTYQASHKKTYPNQLPIIISGWVADKIVEEEKKKESESRKPAEKKPGGRFHNFEQRNTDYDALLKQLNGKKT